MALQLCECGRRVYVLPYEKRHGNQSTRRDHFLCRKCYNSARSSQVAARMQPKPWWAVKNQAT